MSLYTMMLLEGLTDKKHPEGLITKNPVSGLFPLLKWQIIISTNSDGW